MYGAKKIIFGIVTAVIVIAAGIGGYWYYSTADVRRLKDTDNWITFSGNGYTIRIPDGLQPCSAYTIDNVYQVLDCKVGKEIGFATAVTELTPDQIKVMESYDLIELAEMVHSSINGRDLVPIERGNMVYTTYHRRMANMFPNGDEVYIVDAITFQNNKLYTVSAICPILNHPDYDEYLFKILDSFHTTA
ncbi:MAG TPA: hypothetical protein DDX71_00475 [Ruminococcus sp.]|nr:hypothetical protein [Ruminococcus sp.]